jgi:dTDP-glucose 4,6-dehydratase
MREWIYVVDHCKAILSVLHLGEPGEIYNIGTGCVVSNIDLVKRVLDILKKDEKLITFVEDRKGHDFIYKINCDKITAKLNWHPTVNLFNNGLDLTIDYYKDVL